MVNVVDTPQPLTESSHQIRPLSMYSKVLVARTVTGSIASIKSPESIKLFVFLTLVKFETLDIL